MGVAEVVDEPREVRTSCCRSFSLLVHVTPSPRWAGCVDTSVFSISEHHPPGVRPEECLNFSSGSPLGRSWRRARRRPRAQPRPSTQEFRRSNERDQRRMFRLKALRTARSRSSHDSLQGEADDASSDNDERLGNFLHVGENQERRQANRYRGHVDQRAPAEHEGSVPRSRPSLRRSRRQRTPSPANRSLSAGSLRRG